MRKININNMTYEQIINHPVYKLLFRKTKKGFLLRDPRNDRFFHFIFSHLERPECMHILKVIIKATIGITFTKAEVVNPQLIPDSANERMNILDVLILLDDKIYVNIEMQNSKLTDEHNYRFQTYIYRVASNILMKGETLIDSPCFQIIFINEIDTRNPSLIRKLKTVDDKYYVQHKMIVKRVFVHMPYIKNISKIKSIDHFYEFELLNYYFYYRKRYDILDIEERVILFMEKLLNEYSMDFDENMALFKIEMDRRFRRLTTTRLKLAKEQAEKRAMDSERRAIQFEQRANESEEREYESSKANCIDLFQFVYPDTDFSFLNNLSTNQYNLLHKAILEKKSVDELKNLVH